MEETYTLDAIDAVATTLLDKLQSKVVLLSGEMGAGKTTLINAICSLIKVVDTPSSPTFSLINEYHTESGERIYHFDCYRIESAEEALDFGAEEYLSSGDLCLIEWGEKIEAVLPDDYQRIHIEKMEGNKRKIKLT